MGTHVLDPREIPHLQPAPTLRALYRPAEAPHAFRAADARQGRSWQRRTRKTLAEALGLDRLAPKAARPRRIEAVDKGDYVREKLLIRTGERSLMPVYILLPKRAARPLPIVLAFHGHGYGVKDIVGLWEDGGERDVPDGYHLDFAVALCRAGFAVAAPEITCFGERQTDFGFLDARLGQSAPSSCAHAAMFAVHLGFSVLGMRVHDGLRLVDYLETRSDLDTRRLGAMGISGGGMHTFFSTCLDPRIRACVVSGYYSTFYDSVLAMSHCPCNYVPGLHRFGEMYDLVGLIAPRPLLVEAGDHDPIFPIGAVRRSVRRARKVYEVFGARNRLKTDYFQGRHRISGRKAYGFLRAELGSGVRRARDVKKKPSGRKTAEIGRSRRPRSR